MKYLLKNTITNVAELLYEMRVTPSPPLEVIEIPDVQWRDNMLGSIFRTVNLYKPDPRRGLSERQDWWVSDGTNWVDSRDDITVWEYVRSQRNEELLNSDWTQLDDSGLTPPEKAQWTAYRAQLRGVPGRNPGNPHDAQNDLNVTKGNKPVKGRSS